MRNVPSQSATVNSQLEKDALHTSGWTCLIMFGVGIVFAAVTRSEAILLDGIFNGISAVTVYVSARLAGVIHSPGDKTFQFGYAHFEPLVNTVRGLLILTVSAFAFLSAVGSILNGGTGLNPGLAILYSVVVGLGCAAMAIFQRRRAKQTQSPMVLLDAQNWIINAAITATVGAAFLIAFFLQKTSFKGVVPYVDSILVIALTLVTCPMPIRTVLENLRQVFQMAPEQSIQDVVHQRIIQSLGEVGTEDSRIRMGRIGRFLYVVVGLVVKEDFRCERIRHLDELREKLERSLAELNEQVVLDLVVTENPEFASLRIIPKTAVRSLP
ncbi:cation diffusion facilitator family transporter [Planctomycetota bacterium]